MKSTLAILSVLVSGFISQQAFAQARQIPAASQHLSITVGGGVSTLFGDLQKKTVRPAFRGNFDYNFTPFVSAGAEFQVGGLAAGDKDPKGKTSGLYTAGSYTAINANIRMAIGQFLPMPQTKGAEILGGIYVGSGMGIVMSNRKTLVRSYSYTDKPLAANFYDNAREVVVPLNIGINMDLSYHVGLNMNFQYNFTTTEKLDGYDFIVNKNEHDDAYGMASLAIRFYFGRMY